jgi:hypothetical protein
MEISIPAIYEIFSILQEHKDPYFILSYMDIKWKKTMFGLFMNSKYIRSLY